MFDEFFNGFMGGGQSRNQQSSRQSQQQQHQNQRQFYNQQQSNVYNNNYFGRNPEFVNTNSNWNKKSSDKTKQKVKETVCTDTTSSIYWKQKGNTSFSQGKYDEAITFYNQAIKIDESQSIYYNNRGKCYYKKQMYSEALKDAQTAMELDETNIKAYLLSGQCLAELSKSEKGVQKTENAIKKLTKALTLCASQAGDKQKQFERELSVYIMRAKKLLWYKNRENEIEKAENSLEQYQILLQNSKYDQQTCSKLVEEMRQQLFKNLNTDFEIPDYLTCHITLDLMEDPVTTETGMTYERQVIQEHFDKNGKLDPVTRKPISDTLFPNHSIKKAIKYYIEQNPWAFEHSQGENYKNIQF